MPTLVPSGAPAIGGSRTGSLPGTTGTTTSAKSLHLRRLRVENIITNGILQDVDMEDVSRFTSDVSSPPLSKAEWRDQIQSNQTILAQAMSELRVKSNLYWSCQKFFVGGEGDGVGGGGGEDEDRLGPTAVDALWDAISSSQRWRYQGKQIQNPKSNPKSSVNQISSGALAASPTDVFRAPNVSPPTFLEGNHTFIPGYSSSSAGGSNEGSKYVSKDTGVGVGNNKGVPDRDLVGMEDEDDIVGTLLAALEHPTSSPPSYPERNNAKFVASSPSEPRGPQPPPPGSSSVSVGRDRGDGIRGGDFRGGSAGRVSGRASGRASGRTSGSGLIAGGPVNLGVNSGNSNVDLNSTSGANSSSVSGSPVAHLPNLGGGDRDQRDRDQRDRRSGSELGLGLKPVRDLEFRGPSRVSVEEEFESLMARNGMGSSGVGRSGSGEMSNSSQPSGIPAINSISSSPQNVGATGRGGGHQQQQNHRFNSGVATGPSFGGRTLSGGGFNGAFNGGGGFNGTVSGGFSGLRDSAQTIDLVGASVLADHSIPREPQFDGFSDVRIGQSGDSLTGVAEMLDQITAQFGDGSHGNHSGGHSGQQHGDSGQQHSQQKQQQHDPGQQHPEQTQERNSQIQSIAQQSLSAQQSLRKTTDKREFIRSASAKDMLRDSLPVLGESALQDQIEQDMEGEIRGEMQDEIEEIEENIEIDEDASPILDFGAINVIKGSVGDNRDGAVNNRGEDKEEDNDNEIHNMFDNKDKKGDKKENNINALQPLRQLTRAEAAEEIERAKRRLGENLG